MVLSSRDRRYVVVEMVWLGPSLERRRLRFSFQFNDVKDRNRISPAPLFSAGGRRRRLSRGRPLPCQSPVSFPSKKVPKPPSRGKAARTGRPRTSQTRSAIRLRALFLVLPALGGKEILPPLRPVGRLQGLRRA